MMKKYIGSLLLVIAVTMLTGCGTKDQETFFVPTPMVTPEPSQEDKLDNTDEKDVSSEDDDHGYVGNTTTMYAKLGDYDAILNVRTLPSKEGKVVGFLVHTEEVNVISIDDGWASIVYNDEVCYVSADFLVDEKPDYIAPPTSTNKPAISDPNDGPPEI